MDICEINLEKISDTEARDFCYEGLKLCQNGKQDKAIEFANDNRLESDYKKRVKAAFYYLAIAKYYYENNNKEKSGDYFHKAAHLLKSTNYTNQAARAYGCAGSELKEYFKISHDIKKLKLAVRSFGQSKICFYNTGDSDKSEKMYIEEQKTKIDLLQYQFNFGLLLKLLSLKLWRFSSNFGTSFFRWFCIAGGFIIFFSILYNILHYYKYLIAKNWNLYLSPVYFSVMTISTLGYGENYSTTNLSQLVIIFNIVIGYFLLGLGIGIITRKIKGH